MNYSPRHRGIPKPKNQRSTEKETNMVAWDKAKGKQSTGNQQRREIERLTMSIGDTKV